MKLAYLTSQYPKVSHTFIRRELRELEHQGHSVLRLAVRRPEDAVVDPLDVEEDGKTIHCLTQSPLTLLRALAGAAFKRPGRFLSALIECTAMGVASNAGVMRHFAYLIEACFFLPIVQAQGIEHVHVHFGTNPAAVAYLIRHLGGPPYSMMIHGPDEFDDPAGYSLGKKIAASSFTATVSYYASAQLRRWVHHAHWDKIQVVRCIVDERFFDDVRPISRGIPKLLCIGRLSAQKGQLLLIDAFARLLRAGCEAELVLAGDGEMREAVEERIREHGIGKRILITGWIGEDEVRRHLDDCTCLVLPSFAEGLPVVIMEALARGRPVISTYVAGIPELVRPEENGWLVPAGDVSSLVEVMREACSTSGARLEEMGRAGRERVAAQHDSATEAARLAVLIGQGGPRRAREPTP